MLFGIQSSQDVKLSNISRSLQETIPLIRTEKRLSRNLKSAELEKELTPQLVRVGNSRIEPNTVLALDLSDIRKEYAQKIENLAVVRDGSTWSPFGVQLAAAAFVVAMVAIWCAVETALSPCSSMRWYPW